MGRAGSGPLWPFPISIFHHREARPADGFVLAEGTAAGAGEPVPFFEDKAAVFAHRGDDLEMQAGSRGPGEMSQMLQHLFFREGEELRQLQAGAGLLRQKFFHGLTRGAHGNPEEAGGERPVLPPRNITPVSIW